MAENYDARAGVPRWLTLSGVLLLAAMVFVACGTDSTSVAEPAALEDNAGEDSGATETTAAPSQISFANDVQPILEANCVSCHSDTGPGTTHLEMATVDDVASIAEFIAFRVEDKQMPPWPQTGLQEIAYQYDLSMSDEDRQVIIDWAAAGAPLDVDRATNLTGTREAYPPIDADMVINASSPYPGSDKLDDYRCRILDPEFTDTTWVTSIETRPDETKVLHHSLIYHLPASQRASATASDGADGSPGWQCQTVSTFGLDQVAGWAPGTGPSSMPDGSGLKMEAGDAFVVQWHYHYDNGPLPDNSGIALEIASAEQVAAAGGALDPISNMTLVGPVEIPCATYESGPLCDRDAAIDRLRTEFGSESALIPEFVNSQCNVTPADFALFTDGKASSSCDIPTPAGEVVSILPHMHELGTTYRLTLNPGTAEEKILIDIDAWDFQWQMGYYPAEPLMFERGDVLRLECGWDRALWPAGLESRYLVWAEGTEDEMCFGSVAIRR